ncbi:hypothetical protein ACTZWW_21345 [Salinarimonas sp. NSM]|uniref:hypothetical protein n=1 Tax=Salinarimonas sp. NSM TaxID=3458003 RepID=UPI00403563F8
MAIQQKFHVGDEAVHDLAARGVALGPVREVAYTYFGKDGTTSEDLLVRIAIHDDRSVLDVKERAGPGQPWSKRETAITNPEDTRAMLERFGFRAVATMRKTFRSWRNDVLVIDLVQVPGCFTVIEAKFADATREEATRFLRELGFDPDHADSRSSVDIFLASMAVEGV